MRFFLFCKLLFRFAFPLTSPSDLRSHFFFFCKHLPILSPSPLSFSSSIAMFFHPSLSTRAATRDLPVFTVMGTLTLRSTPSLNAFPPRFGSSLCRELYEAHGLFLDPYFPFLVPRRTFLTFHRRLVPFDRFALMAFCPFGSYLIKVLFFPPLPPLLLCHDPRCATHLISLFAPFRPASPPWASQTSFRESYARVDILFSFLP